MPGSLQNLHHHLPAVLHRQVANVQALAGTWLAALEQSCRLVPCRLPQRQDAACRR